MAFKGDLRKYLMSDFYKGLFKSHVNLMLVKLIETYLK